MGQVRRVLRPDASAVERGTMVHAWLERIGWREDGLPGEEELRAIAHRRTPTMSPEQVGALIAEFRNWLDHPEIARIMSRASDWAGFSCLGPAHPVLPVRASGLRGG